MAIVATQQTFQSTFPQGERRSSSSSAWCLHNDFNPRSHKGNDDFVDDGQLRIEISIHVPTRGTTLSLFIRYCLNCDFNPRSHKGNDEFKGIKFSDLELFQSTFPQGERRCLTFSGSSSCNFNPRSHKGNDTLPSFPCLPFLISIHVPTRGTTVPDPWPNKISKFQSTFPQGERPPGIRKGMGKRRFQSTFPQGERRS